MSDQKAVQFDFWWPTSKTASKVMGWALGIIAVGQFINGCRFERLPRAIRLDYVNPADVIVKILLLYVVLGLITWYFIINIGRLVYSRINRTETVQVMKQTRREEAELRALRRRKELKELKDELGPEDDREH